MVLYPLTPNLCSNFHDNLISARKGCIIKWLILHKLTSDQTPFLHQTLRFQCTRAVKCCLSPGVSNTVEKIREWSIAEHEVLTSFLSKLPSLFKQGASSQGSHVVCRIKICA